jgi:predicted ATP-dependent serine protease
MWITCMECGVVHSMFDHQCSNCHAANEDQNVIQDLIPLNNLPHEDFDIAAYNEGWNKPNANNPFINNTKAHKSFRQGQQRRLEYAKN